MEEILEKLGELFDEKHREYLKMEKKCTADYYLLLGETSGIRQALELIEKHIENEKTL